jgi:hypothetical protein
MKRFVVSHHGLKSWIIWYYPSEIIDYFEIEKDIE